jgi:hypothetical protein
MPNDLPLLIRYLTDDLKFRLRRRGRAFDHEFYLIDLSGWKLRLSDRAPFIRVEARHLETLATEDLVASVRAVMRNQHFERRVPILVVEGCSPELRDAMRLHMPFCAILDGDDTHQITTAASDRRMLDLIGAQLPLASLSPYEISSPVTGSRFFGREYEMRTILSHPDTDYVIVGVRRIGKSSLLLELKRRLEEIGDDSVYFFDCSDFHSADDYIRAVVTEVDIRERERMSFQKFPNFLRVKSHRGKRPLTFLLDEVDHLIRFDRRENWALLQALRASSNKGFCRYILTGYREAIEESLNVRAPMYNFVTRLPVANLSQKDTQRLVEVPMENLGVSFERRGDLIAQIFQQTAGHPNFVQFYCYTLVQLMDRQDLRRIGPNDLALVHGDQEFERYVFRTFTANTTDLEKAVVYGMVMDNGDQFTARDVDIVLKKRKVFLRAGQIEEACDNLRMAGVLDKQGQAFAFAIPILTRLLKDHYDVDHLFSKAREDGKL